MTAQVAADLRAAADVLRKDGWTTDCSGDASLHRHCVIDAIALAVDPKGCDDDWDEATEGRYSAATQALRSHLGSTLMSWQEAPGRTADEVIAALEAAADAAERKAAYDEGRWCGECQYGVVLDPPCCTQP